MITLSLVNSQSDDQFCYEYQSCNNEMFRQNVTNQLNCYGFRSCNNGDGTINAQLDCEASQSCINLALATASNDANFVCYAFGSCSNIDFDKNNNSNNNIQQLQQAITTNGFILYSQDLSCSGLLLCYNQNISILTNSSYKTLDCSGSYSCVNTILIPQRQPKDSYTERESYRDISINLYGSFTMYNSTIYSNGNNINIYSKGYYSGYGLTVKCTTIYDSCIIYCYGNGCINMKLICHESNDDTTCAFVCGDSDDDTCIIGQNTTIINNDPIIDKMNNKINNNNNGGSLLLQHLLNPKYFMNKSNTNTFFSKMYNGCKNGTKAFNFSTQYEALDIISTTNDHGDICCSSKEACSGSSITSINKSIFCDGVTACLYTDSKPYGINVTYGNIFASAYVSIEYTNILVSNNSIILCGGKS